MADGKIKELVGHYERLLDEKSRIAALEESNKAGLKEVEDLLCQAISDAGMKNVSIGGYTYTPGVIHKYYLKKEADAVSAGAESRFAPFENDPALADLVKKDINWRSMQTSLREMEDSPGGIPDEVMAVINITDEFGITRRKADTSNMDKVAGALKKRRDGGV